MKLAETEIATRLTNLDTTECGFCHRVIARDDILVTAEANDGSARIAGACFPDQCATTGSCDLAGTPIHMIGKSLGAYGLRRARLEPELSETCFDGALIAPTEDLDIPQEVWLPGRYRDDEILEYAEYPPPEYWLPEVAAAAQQAESDGKRFMWVTWPDGVQVTLATYKKPAADLLVLAYRKAAAKLMTHHHSGQEAQS